MAVVIPRREYIITCPPTILLWLEVPSWVRMTLTYIWPVHGDDVTVETNDTAKHRAGVSSWKVQLPTAATEPSSKLMGGSFGEQIW